jgi:hypothetical protein
LVAAQEEANALMERDPELQGYPLLREHVNRMIAKASNTMN